MDPQHQNKLTLKTHHGTLVSTSVKEVVDQFIPLLKTEIPPTQVTKLVCALEDYFRGYKEVAVTHLTQMALDLLHAEGLALQVSFNRFSVCLDALELVERKNISLEMHFFQEVLSEARSIIKAQSGSKNRKLEIKNIKPAIKVVLERSRWSKTCLHFSDYIVEQTREAMRKEAGKGRTITMKMTL